MTETTEQTIARLAKERAKTILENSDYWSGPGSAKTSAEAVGTLLSYRWQLEDPPAAITDCGSAVIAEAATAPPSPAKRGPKPKDEPAPPVTNGEPESTDV